MESGLLFETRIMVDTSRQQEKTLVCPHRNFLLSFSVSSGLPTLKYHDNSFFMTFAFNIFILKNVNIYGATFSLAIYVLLGNNKMVEILLLDLPKPRVAQGRIFCHDHYQLNLKRANN